MKTIKLWLAFLVLAGIQTSCSSQVEKENEPASVAQSDKVEVYYFHYTRRCATCNAVQSVSKDAVTKLYGDNVSFRDYNLDDEDGEAKGRELEVSGQTLLIVAGDIKIDITNEGFLNARSNPDKLKEIIKEKIDPLI